MFLKIAERMSTVHPGRFRFWIVGDGPQRLELEKMADSLGVTGDVQFVGQQASAFPFIHAMNLLIISSVAPPHVQSLTNISTIYKQH